MSDLRIVLLLVFISFYSSTIFAQWWSLPGISSNTNNIEITDCPYLLDVAVGLNVRGQAETISARVRAPSGDRVDLIFSMPGCEDNLDLIVVMDDDSPDPAHVGCSQRDEFDWIPLVYSVFKPGIPLSTLNNQSGNGTWWVEVYSNNSSPLLAWSLDLVCGEPPQEIISCDGFESCPEL